MPTRVLFADTFLPTAIVVSLIVAIVNTVRDENQYNIPSFPPLRCADREVTYYNRILPTLITISIGNILLVTISWVIHKVS